MTLNTKQLATVRRFASANGWEWPVLAGLVDQESGGHFYWDVHGEKVLALNIEGHYFYRHLSKLAPDKLKEAVASGLAAKKRGVIKVPNSYAARYAMFLRMTALHREAAFRSISSGVGQIMGENYAAMGFPSAESLYDFGLASEANQIDLMVRFIHTKPALVKAVHEDDVTGIAYYYNGPAYKVNHYDTELDRLILKYNHHDTEVVVPDYKQDAKTILDLGYDSVAAFQTEHGLKADGKIGKLTHKAVLAAQKERKKQTVHKPATNAAVVTGTIAAGAGTVTVVADGANNVGDVLGKVEPVLSAVQQVGAYGPKIVLVLIAVLIVGGISYAVVRALKSRATA